MFTHSSWAEAEQASYERLAFLGDSVLGLAVSAEIYPRFGRQGAGRLTKIRAQAVSGRSCAQVARDLEVPERLAELAPAGARRSAEELARTERALASVVEAAIGACFLAHGYERTAAAVVEAFGEQVDFAAANLVDFKSALQERLARTGDAVAYRVEAERGPPHERTFESVAEVDGKALGRGRGRSKKDAEQEAARAALEGLDRAS